MNFPKIGKRASDILEIGKRVIDILEIGKRAIDIPEIGNLGNWYSGKLIFWESGKLSFWEIGNLRFWEIGNLTLWETALDILSKQRLTFFETAFGHFWNKAHYICGNWRWILKLIFEFVKLHFTLEI
jgi:hypothetical protein